MQVKSVFQALLHPYIVLLGNSRNGNTFALISSTVEPPNKGHFGANGFVPCREVVPFSEVK